ncbi:MAG: hypothetical protein U5K79_23985 [Cyclobacteriaceae bacterium]|nr:hypothetical protein [Cyclobacteriaceae bacterium]
MAPGYTNLGLGFDYKIKDKFSLYLSPINLRTTYVLSDSLALAGEFGIPSGKKTLRRLGPSAMISYKDEVLKNVTLDTEIRLVSGRAGRGCV